MCQQVFIFCFYVSLSYVSANLVNNLVRPVMSLYRFAISRIIVNLRLLKGFYVHMGVHKACVLSTSLCTFLEDVFTVLAREGV